MPNTQQKRQATTPAANTIQLIPQIHEEELSYTKNYELLLDFTYERETVPKILSKQGVSLELWQSTYDIVAKYCTKDAKIRRSLLRMLMCFPLFPFQYPCTAASQYKLKQAWDDLVETIQPQYTPLGIRVSLARETLDHSDNQPILGLLFEVLDPKTSQNN